MIWDEKIEARSGLVVPELYATHKDKFKINVADIPGNPETLNAKKIVSIVLRDYGSKLTQWLSHLMHLEDPWRNSRKGLSDAERGNQESSKNKVVKIKSQ